MSEQAAIPDVHDTTLAARAERFFDSFGDRRLALWLFAVVHTIALLTVVWAPVELAQYALSRYFPGLLQAFPYTDLCLGLVLFIIQGCVLVLFSEELADIINWPLAAIAFVIATVVVALCRVLDRLQPAGLDLRALDADTRAIIAKHTGGTFRRTWGRRRFFDGGRLRHEDLLRILSLERIEAERLAQVYAARSRAEAAYTDHLVAAMEAASINRKDSSRG